MSNAARQIANERTIADHASGIDLEAWRASEGVSYGRLAVELKLGDAAQARRYAIGARWPDPDVIDRIVAATDGRVTVFAMHQRRASYLRANPRPAIKVRVD